MAIPMLLLMLVFVSSVAGNWERILEEVCTGGEDFDSRLLEKLIENNDKDGNILVSPFSLNMLLSMMMAGAKGQTSDQIRDNLGYENRTNAEVFAAFRQLFYEIRTELNKMSSTLEIANTIAIGNQTKLLSSFMRDIVMYFQSTVLIEDFANSPEKATAHLNEWVSEKTHKKIRKLFDQSLDRSTAVVLINAIYFKGDWQYRFEKENTILMPFRFNSGQSKMVATMTAKRDLNYGEFEDGKLLELPYEKFALSMFVFLPKETNEEISMAKYLSRMSLKNRIREMANAKVDVKFPKFKIESQFNMVKVLKEMGIEKLFQSDADLSNIDGRGDLKVSQVLQKSFINVEEEGSEAASATADIFVYSIPFANFVIEFHADRPFLFFIRENDRGLILFSGVVNNPVADD